MYVCMYIEYFTDLLIYLLKHYSSIKYIQKNQAKFLKIKKETLFKSFFSDFIVVDLIY